MSEADELYTLKNSFFLGNFTEALAEAETLKLKSEALKLERDAIVYRSHLGLGNYKKVITDIKDSAPIGLLAVRAMAQYFQDVTNNKATVLPQFEEWLRETQHWEPSKLATTGVPALQACAATIYMHEGSFASALGALRTVTTLEGLALTIQVYLRMDRVDLAEKALRLLQERDDESALYQLSAAHVSLALGGESRYKEAYSLYQELQQRYGDESPGPANGLAAACICLRRFDEADKILQELLVKEGGTTSGSSGTTTTTTNVETLVNALSVAQHLGKGTSEGAQKLLAQLQKTAPSHPYVTALKLAESSFDRVAASFSS